MKKIIYALVLVTLLAYGMSKVYMSGAENQKAQVSNSSQVITAGMITGTKFTQGQTLTLSLTFRNPYVETNKRLYAEFLNTNKQMYLTKTAVSGKTVTFTTQVPTDVAPGAYELIVADTDSVRNLDWFFDGQYVVEKAAPQNQVTNSAIRTKDPSITVDKTTVDTKGTIRVSLENPPTISVSEARKYGDMSNDPEVKYEIFATRKVSGGSETSVVAAGSYLQSTYQSGINKDIGINKAGVYKLGVTYKSAAFSKTVSYPADLTVTTVAGTHQVTLEKSSLASPLESLVFRVQSPSDFTNVSWNISGHDTGFSQNYSPSERRKDARIEFKVPLNISAGNHTLETYVNDKKILTPFSVQSAYVVSSLPKVSMYSVPGKKYRFRVDWSGVSDDGNTYVSVERTSYNVGIKNLTVLSGKSGRPGRIVPGLFRLDSPSGSIEFDMYFVNPSSISGQYSLSGKTILPSIFDRTLRSSFPDQKVSLSVRLKTDSHNHLIKELEKISLNVPDLDPEYGQVVNPTKVTLSTNTAKRGDLIKVYIPKDQMLFLPNDQALMTSISLQADRHNELFASTKALPKKCNSKGPTLGAFILNQNQKSTINFSNFLSQGYVEIRIPDFQCDAEKFETPLAFHIDMYSVITPKITIVK